MKNVHTFESFLNEGNISMYKSTVSAALKQLGYDVKQSDLKIGTKRESNYDLITLNGESLCSSSDYAQMTTWIQNAVKEDPKKYGLDPRVLEAMDTKYWADYNRDQTLSGGKKEFAEKSKDFDDTFSLAVSDWNVEADRESRIKGSQIEKVKKIAQEFFNKEGYITVNIAQAMISQES
jgi:hypothetical protein